MSSKTVTIEPLTVGVTEAAAMSDLSIRAIWKAIKEDKLKAVRVGKRTLVPVQNLRSFLGIDAPDSAERHRETAAKMETVTAPNKGKR
jgi:hypothetical protein